MTPTRRPLAAAALAALLTLAAPLAQAQGKGETVRFQDYPGMGNLMIRVAASKGLCEKHGIKCVLQVIPSGPLGTQALLAKSIEVAMVPAQVIAPAVNQGSKLKLISGGQVNVVSVLIAGNHVETPNAGKPFPAYMADMKGKKVGVSARGSGLEGITKIMLVKAGMKPDDVTYVAVGGPNTAYGALTSKQVDYLMMFEPAGAMCDVLKSCKVLWRAATDKAPADIYAQNGGGVGLVVRQDLIDQSPQVVEAIMNVAKEADAFINNPANAKEVAQISPQYFKFDFPKGDEVLARVLALDLETHNFSFGMDRAAIEATLKMNVDLKVLDRAPPLSELIDARVPGR